MLPLGIRNATPSSRTIGSPRTAPRDEVLLTRTFPDLGIGEIGVVNDPGIVREDLDGLDPRVLGEEMREDGIPVVHVAGGRHLMSQEHGRGEVRLADPPRTGRNLGAVAGASPRHPRGIPP